MVDLLAVGIGALLIVQLVGLYWITIQLKIAVFRLENRFKALDNELAEAITSTIGSIGEGIQDFEPPNPMQSVMAEWFGDLLKSKTQTAEVKVISRSQDGTFKSQS